MSDSSVCDIVSADDVAAARQIVRRKYEEQGYDVSGGSIAAYLDSDQASTFGLRVGDTLFGTIAIVRDGPRGLPMDAIYREELAPMRAEGKSFAEVVQFAVDNEAYTRTTGRAPGLLAATPLFSRILSCALAEHIDYLCISINPKHDRFYAMLGFKQIGELKHYGSVNAPAIARVLPVATWQANPFVRSFLGKEIAKAL